MGVGGDDSRSDTPGHSDQFRGQWGRGPRFQPGLRRRKMGDPEGVVDEVPGE